MAFFESLLSVTRATPPFTMRLIQYQKFKLDMRQLASVLLCHSRRLHMLSRVQETHGIGQDLTRFKNTCREEPHFYLFSGLIEEKRLEYKDFWLLTNDHFPNLLQCCGSPACSFLNSATVEFDFSLIGWEKDDSRRALKAFPLEGIQHYKHFHSLKSLAASIGAYYDVFVWQFPKNQNNFSGDYKTSYFELIDRICNSGPPIHHLQSAVKVFHMYNIAIIYVKYRRGMFSKPNLQYSRVN